MMTDVDLEHNGKYQHVSGSRSKALPQKVFNTLASLSTKDQNILCIRDARSGARKKSTERGGAKKRINQLIPRQRVFNVPLASGELGMVSK